MVDDNDRIMLVSGMVNRELAKLFKRRKGLTVLTNDVAAAVEISSQEKADLIEASMEISQERIVLCCAEHFGESTFYHLGGISIAQRIITNPSLGDEYKHQLFASGVQLFASVNVFEGRVQP